MTSDNTLDLNKLAKICARFGSDFPEERATAAAIANRMVRDAGHSWEILFQALDQAAARIAALEAERTVPVHQGGPEWQPVAWSEPRTAEEAIEACLEWAASSMSAWEQNFLVSISGRTRLSPKQIDVLNRLVTKARAAAKAAGRT